jgi:DNA modification methylase
VELIERAIENSSAKGDIVADLFGGSGSTLIAAEKTKRRAFLCELDPKFVDTIITRWCQFTGANTVRCNGEEIPWEAPPSDAAEPQ